MSSLTATTRSASPPPARRPAGSRRSASTSTASRSPVSTATASGEGDFGAPRPGRIHQGKDVWAPCGARLLAARGGRVARTGYDPRLYGHFIVIDGRGTSTDLFYVHLAGSPSAHEGERVRNGERIGSIGRSGNAQSVGCMLHLEVWPHGFRRGSPIDPEPLLRAWDTWS